MLLVSKFKLLSSIGISTVSLASVPTAVSLTASKSTAEFLQPINTTKKTVKKFVKDTFVGFEKKLEDEYTRFGGQVVGNIKQSPEATRQKLQDIHTTAKTATQLVKSQANTTNYYLFEFGDLVKVLLKYIPILLKDTVVELTPSGITKQSLGILKIMEIAKSPKLTNAMASLILVAAKHQDQLSEMTQKDAGAILKILKDLQRGQPGGSDTPISQFLNQVSTNASTIASANPKKTFCNSTKLMIELLVGDTNKIKEIQTTIESIKTLMNDSDLKSAIETIDGLNIDVDDLQTQLDTLKDQDGLGDPCATDDSQGSN